MGNKTRPQTILINKVVKRDDANNITQIITDPSTVLEHTAETYKDWFGNRPINLGFKPQTPDEEYNMEIKRKWDDIYSKHPTDPEIYNHLMEPCTETEFLAHISQIPTKAGGESNITTPLIIKSPLLIKTLHALCNITIKYSILPDKWMNGVIIPIPKGASPLWDSNVTNTRPITYRYLQND